MKYRSIDQIGQSAAVSLSPPRPKMTASEKLGRWAKLRDEYDGQVRLFVQLEYKPIGLQRALREDRSPVSIALADPVLRFQGLSDETYGDATRFSGLALAACTGLFAPATTSIAASSRRGMWRRKSASPRIALGGLKMSWPFLASIPREPIGSWRRWCKAEGPRLLLPAAAAGRRVAEFSRR